MNLLLIRQLHGCISAFIAPSVLFFALTGALQIFGLHEAHGAYQPPALVEELARVHKDQVFALGRHHGATPPGAAAKAPSASPSGSHDTHQGALSTLLLKWFFLVVAVELSLTTAFGVWVGLTRVRGAALFAGLLICGAVIPVLLVAVRF